MSHGMKERALTRRVIEVERVTGESPSHGENTSFVAGYAAALRDLGEFLKLTEHRTDQHAKLVELILLDGKEGPQEDLYRQESRADVGRWIVQNGYQIGIEKPKPTAEQLIERAKARGL